MPKVAIIYYSSTGTNDAMARAVEEGARGAGAETRRKLVAENAPAEAIAQNPAWQAFVDRTAGLWSKGKLANKVYSGFTSAVNAHGGQEATLLALYTTVLHFGGYLVTTGYTDKVVYGSGGNPYGPSVTTGPKGNPPTEADLETAKYLGKRITEVARKLVG
jgi:NAD(P)H dehydrogenase (quinone)